MGKKRLFYTCNIIIFYDLYSNKETVDIALEYIANLVPPIIMSWRPNVIIMSWIPGYILFPIFRNASNTGTPNLAKTKFMAMGETENGKKVLETILH